MLECNAFVSVANSWVMCIQPCHTQHHITALHCTALHCTAHPIRFDVEQLRCSTIHSTGTYSCNTGTGTGTGTVEQCTVLYCIALHCIALFCRTEEQRQRQRRFHEGKASGSGSIEVLNEVILELRDVELARADL